MNISFHYLLIYLLPMHLISECSKETQKENKTRPDLIWFDVISTILSHLMPNPIFEL